MLSNTQLIQQAFALANCHVVADIQTNCVPVRQADGQLWYDTRPMLDPREHCAQVLDMATQALAYAQASGLIERAPQAPHLVRLTAAGRAV